MPRQVLGLSKMKLRTDLLEHLTAPYVAKSCKSSLAAACNGARKRAHSSPACQKRSNSTSDNEDC